MANTAFAQRWAEQNLTVTGNTITGAPHPTQNYAFAKAPHGQNAGKFYVEFTQNATITTAGNTSVGLCTAAATATNLGANIANGAGVMLTGFSNVNGSITATVGVSTASGSLICLAIDFTNSKMWGRLGAAGNWNNGLIATQNPATNTGGTSIAALGGAVLYPYICAAVTLNPTVNITANFGDAAFTGTAPAGFTAGWPDTGTLTTPAANVTVPQASTEVLASYPASTQVVQAQLEVLAAYDPTINFTKVGIEEWLVPDPPARFSRLGYEAWFSIVPAGVFTRVGNEIWFTTTAAATGRKRKRTIVVI